MSIYSAGRPKKVKVDDGLSKIPDKAGEYRHRNAEGKITYIGETCNLRRRTKEHLKNGKIGNGFTVEFQTADGRSSSKTRREHERKKIAQHKPEGNRSGGGEGRIAKRK